MNIEKIATGKSMMPGQITFEFVYFSCKRNGASHPVFRAPGGSRRTAKITYFEKAIGPAYDADTRFAFIRKSSR